MPDFDAQTTARFEILRFIKEKMSESLQTIDDARGGIRVESVDLFSLISEGDYAVTLELARMYSLGMESVHSRRDSGVVLGRADYVSAWRSSDCGWCSTGCIHCRGCLTVWNVLIGEESLTALTVLRVRSQDSSVGQSWPSLRQLASLCLS